MAFELYKKPGFGRRIRRVASTAGMKHLLGNLWSSLGAPVAAVKPTEKTPVILAGTPTVGQTLTVTPATWNGSPAPTVVRVWKADTTVIAGETGLTYVIKAGDSGKTISVDETATNSAGSAVSNSNTIPVA